VKDQGYCGSCWAFSATEQIETNVAMSTGKLLTLAPQQIVSCDTTSYGCSGGWTENAYDYVLGAGGIEAESSYPYTSGTAGVTGTCSSSSSSFVTTISGYSTISSRASQESQMVTQIATSPMSICVDAETWSSYTGGVVTSCGSSVDHCVQVVGYNADDSYWIVRISWGTSWGESGYIYVEAGSNMCAIASDATIASV
jgi:C1A family cysteine protease